METVNEEDSTGFNTRLILFQRNMQSCTCMELMEITEAAADWLMQLTNQR
jgi:hypothetical protein